MMDKEKTFTKSGNIRTSPLDVLYNFVVKSFVYKLLYFRKKCGISNTIDGEENDLLWRESYKKERIAKTLR